MYIAPNSIIHILRGVPLDNSYQHTIHFNSTTEQASYFAGLKKYTLTEYSYIRKDNVLRVGLLADNLFDCNYIMFKNSAYGNRWFYAFITNIEYVNDNTAHITYELDVMQTWYFDYTVQESFVEREHSVTDAPGDNLIPDNLETGEYVSDDFDGTNKMGAYSIVVASTFDSTLDDVAGGMYSGIYSGLYYNVFDANDYASVNSFINKAVNENKASGIVSVFMMPSAFVRKRGEGAATVDISKSKRTTGGIGNYKSVKNNKLYTYPYNFLYVTNLNGSGAAFPYEYFQSDNCDFGLAGDMSCNPQIFLYPKKYKGVEANYNEKMVMEGFPQCSYNTDAFKAWLAQNALGTLFNVAGGAAAIGSASVASSIAGTSAATTAAIAAGSVSAGAAAFPFALVGGALMIANQLSSVVTHLTLPDQANNTQGNSAMVAVGIKDFAFMHMHIRPEFAEIIDEYWNVYGYPCHRVKKPNISSRRHWNYVKTIGVNITGSIPANDMVKIKSVYDNGVTFWRNGSEVAHYELDNSVGTGVNEVG